MNTSVRSFMAGIALTTIFGFTVFHYEPNQATAEVSRVDGLFIFTDSKPVMPYDSLGQLDAGFVTGTQYESIRTNLINRAKKKYPEAEGLMLSLNKQGIDQCLVIKFRK